MQFFFGGGGLFSITRSRQTRKLFTHDTPNKKKKKRSLHLVEIYTQNVYE